MRRAARPKRRAMVLALVLVVIALLTLAAFTFSELMLTERKAAQLAGRKAKARALAESGVEMLRLFVAQEKEVQDQAGGWYDNQTLFRGVLVCEDEQKDDRGRFAVVAPDVEYGVSQGIRFGLENESTRLNLNALMELDNAAPGTGREILMGLPLMTEDVADAMLDWMDADDEPREFGAEVDYYSSLEPAYGTKNGPLETVEELLLVRGVTPWLLFGADANRNGLLDPDESTMQLQQEVDSSDGSMDRGWAAYLTLHSQEQNLQPDGQRKIDLNQDDLEQLYEQLEEVLGSEWATFIVAYRQFGPDDGDRPAAKISTADFELDLSQKAEVTLESVLDLIGKDVRVKVPTEGGEGGEDGSGGDGDRGSGRGGRSEGGNGGRDGEGGRDVEGGQGGEGSEEEALLESPFPDVPGVMSLYLPVLMDHVAVYTQPVLAGRVNINQAPRAVLAGIPGMTPEALEAIAAERVPNPTEADPSRRHETWILAEGIVTLEEMKQLIPFVTCGGSVYRAQVVGYFDRGGPAVRLEAVLDATTSPARIRMLRDLSHLGRGYAVETLGVEAPEW